VRRPLASPEEVAVSPGPSGRPRLVKGAEVDAVREEWVVEDRWWAGRELRRRYFELVLADGRDVVVYRDLEGDRWYVQRA
jgi:hypothetical protein